MQINALMVLEDSHVHFRFSHAFDRIMVILHEGKKQQFFESRLKDGEWSYLKEILPDLELGYTAYAFSYSPDNTRLFIPANEAVLFYENDGARWINPQKITFKKMEAIMQVVTVGMKSIIFQGIYEKSKEISYFFTSQLDNGDWSTPLVLKGYSLNDRSLALTASQDHFIYVDWEGRDITMKPVPPLVRSELKKLRASQAVTAPAMTVSTSSSTTSESVQYVMPRGQYYALLIGNEKYENDKLDLIRPLDDVRELKETLLENYRFNPDNVMVLENSSRDEIIGKLFNLREEINEDDNLLIFYAGHGHWDSKVKQGYWWPVDSDPKNPSKWLSNSDLREQIRGINSRHTLLISDACFSGGLFKTRGREEIRDAPMETKLLYRLPSRRAITSGAMSTVPDNSVFFEYLIKYLKENDKKFISSGELFTSIRRGVLNNGSTVPQEGVILNTGDEGGDFIFIKKD